MRSFVLIVLVAGCGGGEAQHCEGAACPNGNLYQVCSRGNDCYYLMDDGSEVSCNSCGDCNSAITSVSSWCDGQGLGGGLSGGSTNGGSTDSICSTSGQCANGGWYQVCESPDGSHCSYKTSSGQSFACSACSDCNDAAVAALQWCQNSTAPTCDILGQNCGVGEKCVDTFDSEGNSTGAGCFIAGTVKEGGTCTVQTDANVLLDDCRPGLVCSNLGANAVPECRRICASDGDCQTGEACLAYGSNWGACQPTCAPFTDGCPANNDCSGSADDIAASDTSELGFFYCKPTGAGAPFSGCGTDGDCGAGLSCSWSASLGAGYCLPNCDGTHACPTTPSNLTGIGNPTCVRYSNQNGAGYCVFQ
jgi:hypothetical protein